MDLIDNKPNNFGAFTCLHCRIFAQHVWFSLEPDDFGVKLEEPRKVSYEDFSCYGRKLAQCSHCYSYSLWDREQMLYPVPAEHPAEPLPVEAGETANEYYKEAASIASKSQRAANAMLRAALESMLREIFEDYTTKGLGRLIGKNKKRFSARTLKVMEKVRITGNKALHPNQIEQLDHTSASDMLWLLEYVSRELISDHKRAEEICDDSKIKELPKTHSSNKDEETGPYLDPKQSA